MPTPTSTSMAAKKPVFPDGAQVYDALMYAIEPELVHTNLKQIDASYAHETPAERAARYKRYTQAFAQYKKEFKAWSARVAKAVNAYKTAVLKAVEADSHSRRHAALLELDKQLQSS